MVMSVRGRVLSNDKTLVGAVNDMLNGKSEIISSLLNGLQIGCMAAFDAEVQKGWPGRVRGIVTAIKHCGQGTHVTLKHPQTGVERTFQVAGSKIITIGGQE